MKNIFLFLSILISFNSCSQNTSEQNNDTIVEYTSATRGYFHKIIITNKTLSSTKDRNEKIVSSSICTKEQWNTITFLLKDIDIENIQNLKAPSDARTTDRAAHDVLVIKYNDETYESQSFDSGTPPKEIELLVKAILTLGKTVEKQ